MKGYKAKIDTILDDTVEKAQTNDNQLKSKLEERINEVNQLKALTGEYTAQVQGASSLSAGSLVSGLQAIGSKYNIDKISGVVEGREKKIEKTMKDASNIYLNFAGGKTNLSDKEIQDIVEKNYRHLSDEELEYLVFYYRNKMDKIYAEYTGIPFNGTDYELLIIDGKYQLAEIEPKTGKISFLEMDASWKIGASVSGKVTTDNYKDKTMPSKPSTTVGSVSASLSAMKGTDSDGMNYSVGNIKTVGSIGSSGVGGTLGVNALEVGRKDIISFEDDLYKYSVDFKVTFLSAQMGAKLGKQGFDFSTPGLIGVSVSGGRVELIDINVDI